MKITTPNPASSTPALSPAPEVLRAVQYTRALAVGCLLGLIVLGLAWELFLAPLPSGSGALALKVLPLCIPLAGLLKHRMYTYRWLSLMVWIYFTEGVVRAWSDRWPSNALALLEVVLCVLLFAACALHVRLRLKAAKASAQGSEAAASAGTLAPP